MKISRHSSRCSCTGGRWRKARFRRSAPPRATSIHSAAGSPAEPLRSPIETATRGAIFAGRPSGLDVDAVHSDGPRSRKADLVPPSHILDLNALDLRRLTRRPPRAHGGGVRRVIVEGSTVRSLDPVTTRSGEVLKYIKTGVSRRRCPRDHCADPLNSRRS